MDFKVYLFLLVFCNALIYSSDSQSRLADSYLACTVVYVVSHTKSPVDQVRMLRYRSKLIDNYLDEREDREILRSHLNYHLKELDNVADHDGVVDNAKARSVIKKFVKPHQRAGNGKYIINSQDFMNMYQSFHSSLVRFDRSSKQDISSCVGKCKNMIKSEIEIVDARESDNISKLAEMGIIVTWDVVHAVRNR